MPYAICLWHISSGVALSRAQFYRVAVKDGYEAFGVARPPADSSDLDAHFATLSFLRLNVWNAERNVAIVARRVGMSGHIGDTHQMKLLPGAQIVPASGESQIGTRQGIQSERVFIKVSCAFDVGYQESGVVKTSDGDWH